MKLRLMTCCCCGDSAGRWRQHWNRDTGYGVCVQCVEKQRKKGVPEAEIADYYGVENINWGRERTARNCKNWDDGRCEVCGCQWQQMEIGADYKCPHFEVRA